ncbi:MAG: efflux RND transporter periplasmic adaptor subunit [Steroidobacteraceae bacterium]
MNRKWLIIGGIAALIIVPVALKLTRSEAAKEVDAEQVALRTLTPSILASGALTYESQVMLTPEISGRVKEILIAEGDAVTKGQLLLRLDPQASLAEIAQTEAILRQSALNIEREQVTRDAQVTKLKRFQALRDQGLIDANAFDELTSQKDLAEVQLRSSREEYKQTEARLAQAQERLAKTEIRSPLTGKVIALFIKVGETAVPSVTSIAGSTLMQVADTGSVNAEVNVDETDIARIKTGAQARIVPAAFPDKSLNGVVGQVAVSPRQATGSQNKTYPVKIRLSVTDDVMFHPGMSCRAEILTRGGSDERVVAVPVQAVKYEASDKKNEPDKTSVFVVKDGKVSKREVGTGTADDSYIEITKGLKADEQIVVGPIKVLQFLRNGEQVSIKKPAVDEAKADTATDKS